MVFAVERDDEVLLDDTAVHGWVSHWTERLAPLGRDAGAVAASVTLDRALVPDRERAGVENGPAAPVNVWVGLTFAASRPSRRGAASSAVELMSALRGRLPAITERLRGASGQAARPVGAQELCEMVRGAYDYEAGRVIEEAYRAGSTAKLTWSDVGPASEGTSSGAYRHDGSVSAVWAMSASAARQLDRSTLVDVLGGAGARTRMTVLYRMVGEGLAARMAEADRRSLPWRVDGSPASIRAAGLTCWGLLLTATGEGERLVGDLEQLLDDLPASVRIALRRVQASEGGAFAAGLPLALALAEQLELPRRGRRPR
jgi:hypothetical protein